MKQRRLREAMDGYQGAGCAEMWARVTVNMVFIGFSVDLSQLHAFRQAEVV